MSDHVEHCPFLDRADSRCSEHLSLEHLQNAFRYCFGAYATCPQYAQMVIERRARRAAARREPGEELSHGRSAAAEGVVQVTIAGRVAKQLSNAA